MTTLQGGANLFLYFKKKEKEENEKEMILGKISQLNKVNDETEYRIQNLLIFRISFMILHSKYLAM